MRSVILCRMYTERKGSVSLFAALLAVSLLALFMVILESARYAGLKLIISEAGEAALDSVFAAYHTELFEQYGLLFYPGGKEGGTISCEEIETVFNRYLEDNINFSGGLFGAGGLSGDDSVSSEVTELVTAADYNGEIFIRSALDFFKFDAIGEVLDTVSSQAELFRQGDEAREELAGELQLLSDNMGGTVHAAFQRAKKEEEVPPGDTEEEREVTREEVDAILAESPLGVVDEVKVKGYLSLVMPSEKTLSGYRIPGEDLPSKYAGDGRTPEGLGLLEEVTEKAAFNEYLLRYFSSFMSEEAREGVQYELEYILYGKETDDENFKTVMNRLMWMREGMNLAHILMDGNKGAACELMATVLIGWTGFTGLIPAVKLGLEAAWAYAEAIADARIILAGGKVPIMKTAATWNLDLTGIVPFLSGQTTVLNSQQQGMGYTDYLRLLLFLSDGNELAYRAMDMVQMNIRKTEPYFLMSSQIYAMEVKTAVRKRMLFGVMPLVRNSIPAFGDIYDFSVYFSQVY